LSFHFFGEILNDNFCSLPGFLAPSFFGAFYYEFMFLGVQRIAYSHSWRPHNLLYIIWCYNIAGHAFANFGARIFKFNQMSVKMFAMPFMRASKRAGKKVGKIINNNNTHTQQGIAMPWVCVWEGLEKGGWQFPPGR